MRWNVQKRKQPRYGDQTLQCMFLWVPMTLEGETRWLEYATVKYAFSAYSDWRKRSAYGWHPIMFVDDDKAS